MEILFIFAFTIVLAAGFITNWLVIGTWVDLNIPISIGFGLLGIFVYIEGRVENPVLDLNVFRENRAYSLFNLTALINFSATYSLTFLLSIYN